MEHPAGGADLTCPKAELPLTSLAVFEVTATPAAAFAAAMAGDLGAKAIIIEQPVNGSPLRQLGPPSTRAAWWAVLGRNKRSLALDVFHPEAQEVKSRIGETSGILFRDEVPEGEEIARYATGIVDQLLHASGSDRPELWPWSRRSEFAGAAAGTMAITGRADGPAVLPEMPLADYCAGTLGLSAALAELRAANAEQRTPRRVVFALHEALMRMNEWQVVVGSALGKPELRNGNRFPMNANIGNVFRTRDNKLLTVSAATPAVAHRLLEMIGGPELAADPRFATPAARRESMDALDSLVATWIAGRDSAEVLEMAQARDVVVGPIQDAVDVAKHPQIRARENLVTANGTPMPAPAPRFSGVPPRPPGPAPATGEHTADILSELGFTAREQEELFTSGVVWSSERQ